MIKTIKYIYILLFSALILSCSPSEADRSTQIAKQCNAKSKNLAEYGECRCRKLTGSKSYDDAMDNCMTNKAMYAEGYTGPTENNAD